MKLRNTGLIFDKLSVFILVDYFMNKYKMVFHVTWSA